MKTKHIANPFSIPPIVQEKVSLTELLTIIRNFVNKEYMPTATGRATTNSKPDYVKTKNQHFSDFPLINSTPDIDATGFYAFDEHWFDTVAFEKVPTKAIFYYIRFTTVSVLINLLTEDTIVRVTGEHNDFKWLDEPNRTIAIDRIELTNFE